MTRVGEIIRRTDGKIRVFCGCDTLALESVRLGAAGWVGGVVNVLPREHVQLLNLASRQGDLTMAHKLHRRLSPVLSMMEDEGKYTQFVKAGCSLVGHPVGPPRRPLLWPTPEEMARLQKELSALTTLPTPAVTTCPNKTLRGESARWLSPSEEYDGEKGVR